MIDISCTPGWIKTIGRHPQRTVNIIYLLQDMFISIKYIPAKPLHNHDIVSVHFNHFYCPEICDKLRRDLAVFTYIYLNVDEC